MGASAYRHEVGEVYRYSYSKPLRRPLIAFRVSCGFPSPAEDYVEGSLDLAKFLVKHPMATFYVRVAGESMTGAGIFPGNLLVVDRAAEVREGNVVVARIGDELCIKRFTTVGGRVVLMSENERFPHIEIGPEMDFEIWGRVLHSIQSF
ncbi:MAG TPA: translesion error-prone DNA polymerase V autoproteolytic subunit [Pyrinomonadaceae bacterium]